MLGDMIDEYPRWGYDLFRRNCRHFAEDLCSRIGVQRLPDWVYGLARLCAAAEDFMQDSLNQSIAQRLQEILPESLASFWTSTETSTEEAANKPSVEGALPVDSTMAYPPL